MESCIQPKKCMKHIKDQLEIRKDIRRKKGMVTDTKQMIIKEI